MAGSNVSNQGIAHLAKHDGGFPLCRSARAHITTTADKISRWPRVCKKCAAIMERSRKPRNLTPS